MVVVNFGWGGECACIGLDSAAVSDGCFFFFNEDVVGDFVVDWVVGGEVRDCDCESRGEVCFWDELVFVQRFVVE